MLQSLKQPVKNRLLVISALVSHVVLFVTVIISIVLGRKLRKSETARKVLKGEIADKDAFNAQKPYVPRNHDLFTAGNEAYIDIDGDGQKEHVSVADMREPMAGYTKLSACFSDGRSSSIEYDGYYDSIFMAGDLGGNGTADILLVLADIGSNHGLIKYKTLHFRDGQWKEYLDTFLSNPEIKELQPPDFGMSFFCIGATIIEGENGNLLRTVWHDANDNNLGTAVKYKVRCVDASCRDGGWYVESVQVIDDYYAPGVRESIIPSQS